MSNPEASENKTNKKKHQKPVPRFMSLTWLRLHMKFFIYAVVLTFVVSLFFIGYGTVLDHKRNERNEEDYRRAITNEANDKYKLPDNLQDKANESVITLTYNNDASNKATVDLKTFNRELKNNEGKAPKENVLDSLIHSNAIALYAKSKNLISEQAIDNAVNIEKEFAEKNNSNEFEYKLIRNGLTLDEYKHQMFIASATAAVSKNLMVKMSAASATEDYIKAYYESHKMAFKKDNQISFDNLLISPNAFVASITVTDEQINAYYEEHKNDFLSSNRANVAHIFIDPNDPDFIKSVDVNEADLRDAYASKYPNKDKTYQDVREQLLQEKRTELADQAAENKLTEVYFDVFGNPTNAPKFLKYVKKYTKNSNENTDGSLPAFFKGELTDDYAEADSAVLREAICDGNNFIVSDIEKAVFAYENLDSSTFPNFTDVIKTKKGYHIFMVKSFSEPVQKKLTDSLKAEIKDIIAKKAANEEASKVAANLVKDNASASIEDLVKAYGRETSKREHSYKNLPFNEETANTRSYELFNGFGQFSKGTDYLPEFHKAVLDAIKANNFNKYLEPIETQFGWNIVKVTDYQTDKYDTFEEVRDTIRHILTFEPSDAEINKYFEDNKAKYSVPPTRTVRQIVCGSMDAETASKDNPNNDYYKETIEKAYKELEGGAAFSNLARKYSTDPSSFNGGLMPAMTKGSYDKNLDEAIWNLKVGEFTKPIQKDDGSWVIAMLDSENPGVEGSLTPEVTNQIKAMYYQGYYQEAATYFVKELMNNTKVERNQELIDAIH